MFAVPVPPPDSTTSGYSVPWTRNSHASPCWPASSVISLAARSNARMNSRPMTFRFCSGSVTPASAERNAPASFATVSRTPVAATKSCSTCSASPLRSRP